MPFLHGKILHPLLDNDATILSLTVSRLKNRCIPRIFWLTAIFIVVTKYSNLFPSFTLFLNLFHFLFCDKLIVCPKATYFVQGIRDPFSLI